MIDGASSLSRWRALPIVACFVSLALGSAARAEEPVVAWSAPEGCPDASAVRARVGQLLARSTASKPLSAVGQISKRGDRHVLSLELEQGGHHGSRTLEGPSCASLAEAAAFLIAVTVDPNFRPAPDEPASAPEEPEPEPKPEPLRSFQPPPIARSSEPAAPRLEGYRAALTVGGFFGGPAGPSGELGLGLGLAFSWLRVELRGAHVFARTGAAAAGGVRGRFDTQHLGLAACPEWGRRIRGGPCLWGAALRTHATTRGLPNARDLSLFWAMAGLSLASRARLYERLELSLEGGAGIPLAARPSFAVAGVGTIGEVAYLSGYLRLGIGLELP